MFSEGFVIPVAYNPLYDPESPITHFHSSISSALFTGCFQLFCFFLDILKKMSQTNMDLFIFLDPGVISF